jgi:hypothetical protein
MTREKQQIRTKVQMASTHRGNILTSRNGATVFMKGAEQGCCREHVAFVSPTVLSALRK